MTTVLIPVDFGNADEDSAVRLTIGGAVEYLRTNGIELTNGMRVLMTDGELTAEGVVELRGGMWIARITRFE